VRLTNYYKQREKADKVILKLSVLTRCYYHGKHQAYSHTVTAAQSVVKIVISVLHKLQAFIQRIDEESHLWPMQRAGVAARVGSALKSK